MREFLVPAVLGLLVTAAAWNWDPAPPDLSRDRDAEVFIDTPYVLVPAPGTADHESILLRYNATPRHGGILDLHAGAVENGTWSWDGRDLTCLQGGDCTPQGAEAFALDETGTQPVNTSAVFGTDGLLAEVTFYIFTETGHLLATNTPRSQWEQYDLHGEFTRFSGRVWWFGDGPTPAGASRVPEYRSEARALLDGTPVGGVQSGVLVDHEYAWLLGDVWMTASIDALVATGPTNA